jgi:hypothetical protein
MTKTITTVTAATSVWKILSHPDGNRKAALTATHANPAASTLNAVSGSPVKRSSPHRSRPPARISSARIIRSGGSVRPGSYVFIHHLLDGEDRATAGLPSAMRRALGRVQFRTRARIRDLFGGLELAPPGLVLVPQWRPGPGTPSEQDWPVLRLACAGLARKPYLARKP